MDGLGFSLGVGLPGATLAPLPLSGLACWYDPSDTASLFQDPAGTIPVTASGTPVALMRDKSGNGHHMVQSSAAARPIYRAAGVQRWLEFDGVDDVMTCSTAPHAAAATVALSFGHAGFRSGFATLFRAGADMPRLYLVQSAPSHIRCFWGSGFLFLQRAAAISSLATVSALTLVDGSSAQIQSGGQTATVNGLAPGGPAGGMTLGNPDFFGRIHGLAYYGGAMDAASRAQLGGYLNSLAEPA